MDRPGGALGRTQTQEVIKKEVTMAISDAEMQTIITDPNGMELLVAKAKELGDGLYKNQMTTAQIRALFGEVRQIEAEWGHEPKRY